MLAIDHVVLPVVDLGLAAAEVETRYGLRSLEGGHHPSWGTANRIVPLGDTYVELVAVVDPETAAHNAFGTWIASARAGQPLGWAVRTDAIEAVGQRLGLAVVPGSRATPGGELISWQSAGLEIATREPGLPFFIQWGDGVPYPGSASVDHPGGPARLRLLSVSSDALRLADWLGQHDLPISITVGPSRLAAVIVTQGSRDLELQASASGSPPPAE